MIGVGWEVGSWCGKQQLVITYILGAWTRDLPARTRSESSTEAPLRDLPQRLQDDAATDLRAPIRAFPERDGCLGDGQSLVPCSEDELNLEAVAVRRHRLPQDRLQRLPSIRAEAARRVPNAEPQPKSDVCIAGTREREPCPAPVRHAPAGDITAPDDQVVRSG